MENLGLTKKDQNANTIRHIKKVRLTTTFFIIAALLPFLTAALFGIDLIKGKIKIGPEYSVAKVVTSTSSGSCFRISQTKLLTAKHVVAHLHKGDEVAIIFDKFEPALETVARILYMPEDELTGYETSFNDYAVLELFEIENLEPVPELMIGSSSPIDTREEVYAIGYPEGNNENRITDGIISATSFTENDQQYNFLFDVNVDVDRGNSGGPLILKSTEDVIGLIIMVSSGTHTNYNLALKIDMIVDGIEKNAPTINLNL